MNGNDQDYQISWETDRCSVRVDMEGDIRFADDDRGIESMDRSARFEMEVRIGRDVRRVLVEREGGANVYRYWVGRDEQSWDARAQDWFATVLPELFRHTTFKAGPGVERFLSQGGPNAVFTEVEQIHSDHVAGIYLELLMERADLSTDELGRVLKVAGGQLESDHQLGELLIAFAEQEGLSEAHRRQFLDATATLESDHQMGQVLGRLLDEEGLANDLLLDVLRAVDDFDSDHNRGQIINVLIEQGDLTERRLVDVLGLLDETGSEHEVAEALIRLARSQSLGSDAREAFIRVAEDLDSERQRDRSMAALARGSQRR